MPRPYSHKLLPFREELGNVPTQPGGGRAKARPYSHDPLRFREELGTVPTQIGGGRAKARPYIHELLPFLRDWVTSLHSLKADVPRHVPTAIV